MSTTFLRSLLLNPPAYPPCPAEIEWGAVDIAASVMNPFNAQAQIQSWGNAYREIAVTFQALSNAQALALAAWIESLQGVTNCFQLGDPLNLTPQGPIAGTYAVSGAGQSGFSLVTSGGSGLQAGDWIEVPVPGFSFGYLYRVTSVDGGTLGIWPNLRVGQGSPTDGAGIIVTNTQGIWRLKENARSWQVSKTKVYKFALNCQERL
jgi:hypothetical protein